jgi:hypothetical protein
LSKEALEENSVWDWRLPSKVLSHDDHVELLNVAVSDLEFSGGDSVNLAGMVSLRVNGWSSDPERGGTGEDSYSVHFAGYWLPDGIELDEIR